ncbi:MAG: asparaginase [Acidimicrobiales bacterium mtb01]|nr:asparaginase [Actinomycetota bacterium]TEX46733.1 MAG: asparaginase [Acidimicrobiales bacterium mtb01]
MTNDAVDPLSGYEPIAASYRSGRLESVHHAAVVALDADGRIAFAAGDPDLEIYPRSSMKPLQANAMLAAGLDLPDELLALVCSSHDGLAQHLDGVRRILASVGLDESALANTPDLPLDDHEASEVLRRGGAQSSLQQNCSGKHAGMLATCVAAGWPRDSSYLREDHPLQRAITDSLPALASSRVAAIGVDGCGAPAHVIGLLGLARAFRNLATGGAGGHGERVHRAMSSHPVMVGGPKRDVSLLMEGVPGLMAKDGAEGVFAVALPDGRAVAMKVADGANRARPPIMQGALSLLGIDTSSVDPAAFASPILGHGRPVGEVRIVGLLAAAVGGRN